MYEDGRLLFRRLPALGKQEAIELGDVLADDEHAGERRMR
jgi:hypothetical protein